MANVTLRNTKGTPLTYTEVDNNFKFCDSDVNLIINGGFNIWQRGTSFTSPASGTYTADRFRYATAVGGGTFNILRSTDVPTQAQSGSKTNFSLHMDVTTADTSIASTEQYSLQYHIEGYDYAQVEGNTYTLSFWVKGTKTGVHCVSFRNTAADRSYIVEYTINSTATWEYKTVPVVFNYSGGTWDYTNGIGLTINWILAAGSSFQTTADAWQTGNFLATSNQVNAVDSATNDFRIALVKFEPGAEATQFRFRHFEREVSLCQRYYEKSYNIGTDPGTVTSTGRILRRAYVTTSIDHNIPVNFKTRKRSTPTVTIFSPATGAGARIDVGGDVASSAVDAGEWTAHLQLDAPTAAASANTLINAHFTASAEL